MADQRAVHLHTTHGLITIELYWTQAPRTCHNIHSLAKQGYYNGVSVHRVIPGFMIQTGDPTGTGRGGSSVYGGKFADEITKELRHTGAGVVSMANSGKDTNGSQFFITLAPTPHLDGKHTVFGRVRNGINVVRAIGGVATDANDRPRESVRILRAEAD
ncbi:Peptidyl-prolyl cis-trans isomerase-like 1 [Coemansia erecta]|uniref:Peptidyl-prolyl cis-trans isomerase n=1 Tax=Coemansia erecta TaxID=147472 RepID=A0A9W7XUM5_9FUNG|nr:Peptidyl-prolyl cis-trans isomerase-like 1 [Coemansia erecta]